MVTPRLPLTKPEEDRKKQNQVTVGSAVAGNSNSNTTNVLEDVVEVAVEIASSSIDAVGNVAGGVCEAVGSVVSCIGDIAN